jgi:hypothetical protein
MRSQITAVFQMLDQFRKFRCWTLNDGDPIIPEKHLHSRADPEKKLFISSDCNIKSPQYAGARPTGSKLLSRSTKSNSTNTLQSFLWRCSNSEMDVQP